MCSCAGRRPLLCAAASQCCVCEILRSLRAIGAAALQRTTRTRINNKQAAAAAKSSGSRHRPVMRGAHAPRAARAADRGEKPRSGEKRERISFAPLRIIPQSPPLPPPPMPSPPPTAAPAADAADSSASHFERMDLNAPHEAAASSPAANASSSAAASSSSSSASALSPTSAAALQSVVNGCTTVLIQLLDRLQLESDQPLLQTVPLDAKRLSEYAEILTHQLTRFVLFSSSGDLADSAAALPGLAEEISNHLSGVSCVLRSMLAPSLANGGAIPGPTQRAGILAVHRAILDGMRAIILQLQKHLLAKANTKLQTALTGQVWALLDKELKALPLTNAHAIGKGVLAQCALIKDAREEIGKIKLKDPSTGGSSEGKDDDADDDDDDDDDDFDDLDDDDSEDSALSPSEFALVAPSIQLITIAQNLLKAVYLFLLKCGHSESRLENVEFMEQLLVRVKVITRGADELVESLYAPQDRAAVSQAHEHLCGELRKLAQGVVDQHRAQQPPATWPMKDATSSSSAAAPAASDSAAAATPASADAAEGPIPLDEPARWLQKVSSVIQACEQDAAAAMTSNGAGAGAGAGAK